MRPEMTSLLLSATELDFIPLSSVLVDNWGSNSERGITDILHSVTTNDDGKRGCLCTPLTFVDKYSRINGDCRT